MGKILPETAGEYFGLSEAPRHQSVAGVISRRKFLKYAFGAGAAGAGVLLARTLGVSLETVEAAPPIPPPPDEEIVPPPCRKDEICIEEPKPIETLNLGETFPISDKASETRGASIAFRATDKRAVADQKALVAWHQLDHIPHYDKNGQLIYYEGVYHLYSEVVQKGKEPSKKVLLAEIKLSEEKEERAKQLPMRVYVYEEEQQEKRRQAELNQNAEGGSLILVRPESGWTLNPDTLWGFVWAWTTGNEKGWPRVGGWRISDEGEARGGMITVEESEHTYHQLYPSVAKKRDGAILVGWQEDENTPEYEFMFRIKGQIFNQEGKSNGSSFEILRKEDASLQHPQLVWVEKLNRFLLTCMDPRWIGGQPRVRLLGQWLFGDGKPEGDSFLVSKDFRDKSNHSLAVNAQGECLEAWGNRRRSLWTVDFG